MEKSNAPTTREIKILAVGFEMAQARVKELEGRVKALEFAASMKYLEGWADGHDSGWQGHKEWKDAREKSSS